MEIFDTNLMPTLIHTTGMAVITIFLSAILFIYTADDGEMQNYDRIILLDKVVNIKNFFTYLGFLFIPPFFWGINTPLNISIFVLGILGISYSLWELKNTYFWIKDVEPKNGAKRQMGYRQKLREEFLEQKGNISEKLNIWSSTWSHENLESLTERRMTKIFFKELLDLAQNDDGENVRDLLYSYNANRDSREFRDWSNVENSLKEILDIDYLNYTRDKDEKAKHIFYVSLLMDILNFIIKKSIDSGASYILFKTLEEHISEKEEEYQKYLFTKITKTLFDAISESDGKYDIWSHYFPPDWKINSSNLDKSQIPILLFNNYLQWTRDRVGFDKEWDNNLDNVSSELFNNLSPSWWSEIITYLVRPFGENRIKNLIEHNSNFGFGERIFIGNVNDNNEKDIDRKYSEKISIERQNAIDLAIKYFPREFGDITKIRNIIDELESLDFEDDKLQLRRGKLIEIFKAFLNTLEKTP
jgi:hypothetical protein